jgi:hypothetical protein
VSAHFKGLGWPDHEPEASGKAGDSFALRGKVENVRPLSKIDKGGFLSIDSSAFLIWSYIYLSVCHHPDASVRMVARRPSLTAQPQHNPFKFLSYIILRGPA